VSMSPTPSRALPEGLAPVAQVLLEVGHPNDDAHANGCFERDARALESAWMAQRVLLSTMAMTNGGSPTVLPLKDELRSHVR
jgi:hypothetical protein